MRLGAAQLQALLEGLVRWRMHEPQRTAAPVAWAERSIKPPVHCRLLDRRTRELKAAASTVAGGLRQRPEQFAIGVDGEIGQ